MIVSVITAVTRPKNLSQIADSISVAALNAGCDIKWYWKFDMQKTAIGGHRIKNELLNQIEEGWVWFLDDDTVAHPDILSSLRGAAENGYDALVVSQSRPDLSILKACQKNCVRNKIDIGQAIIQRHIIGESKMSEELYNGDGIFLEEVMPRANVLYLDKVLSLHNAIGDNT